ncbi:MAG: TetR/AcrR family transcriptional regulator [Deinococcota bacterium]|uniref:Transcriptional regulator, TetR family n=1 Tax=Allomeiothermus silvanus (strain ATCC 700542 / DSM 9946 / NBRC 106475 / NCIMB 13440 / VI-R2) TaxID=526227 RepID=D7BET6_ALLS1|nr:helix-turn-helix domain-containing protein [Allomeiothermus silvanus]ADH63289.1 transcriptional regulator, TetR family [Allomeiothermus silvanus DSM 9946]MBI5812210.1 helix-turn-helix transcriptional regulator [Allomeiothermus silvanus]MCL6568644.1 TetR/AcrR family transcriptional regulator [Allomeiothermus silvanus]
MNTREALLERAKAAFAERGYAATSLELLARSLGLSKAAVYHYFPSKRALLEALLEEALEETRQALNQPAGLEQRLLGYALAYRGQVEPLTALMTAHSGRRGGDQEAVKVSLVAMQQGMDLLAGVLETVVPGKGRVLAVIFSSIVHGAYMVGRHLPGYEVESLVREGVRVFVRGLG